MSNFDNISTGRFFKAGGVTYKKLSPQVYVDPTNGFEVYWDQFFDAKIETATSAEPTGNPGQKFVVDPQTRVMKPNPSWLNATAAMGELWGSALFDCGPEDYDFMVKQCISWGKAAKALDAQAE